MVPTMAVLAALGLTLVGLGLPLWAGWVGPNRWYGFRTPRTLNDPVVWRHANQIAGRDLAVGGSGLALFAMGAGVLGFSGLWAWLLALVPIGLTVVHTVWAVSAWLAEHDAASAHELPHADSRIRSAQRRAQQEQRAREG